MISCKAVTKILCGNSEKSVLECEKNGFKKHLPAIFLRDVFMSVFLIQFEINLHLSVFQKAQSCKLIPS